MNGLKLILLAAAAAALTAPVALAAQAPDTPAQRLSARGEIERILNADNLDTSDMEPSEVVEEMQAIQRGGAPEDFWAAYQAHVQAWSQYAQEIAQARGNDDQPDSVFGFDQVSQAQEAISSTFAEVERIARRYGARLPMPPEDLRSIA